MLDDKANEIIIDFIPTRSTLFFREQRGEIAAEIPQEDMHIYYIV